MRIVYTTSLKALKFANIFNNYLRNGKEIFLFYILKKCWYIILDSKEISERRIRNRYYAFQIIWANHVHVHVNLLHICITYKT